MKSEEVYHPTPAHMTTALLKAARARRWNHWQHEVKTHAGDWVEAGAMRKPLTAEQFARLPAAVAEYRFVELCVYRYKRQVVWGYYCKKLLFEGNVLSRVLTVLEPMRGEILHCMRFQTREEIRRALGRTGKAIIPVRW